MAPLRDKQKPRARRGSRAVSADEIVDAAIALAGTVGWDGVRLRLLAERLGVPMPELLAHFRDLDAIADAWFGRAWEAMLAPPPEGFASWPGKKRLRHLILRWFDALARHRRVSVEMIREKLYPSHPHHWVPMIFNLSRTIHWLRDAAILDAGGRRRQVEEIGLTLLFLAALAVWARDETPNQERTRAFLDRALARGDRLMVRLYGAAPPPGGPVPPSG
ncbi:MAG: TetR/AcrR family transcriptional regulator [Proteobacteria bacterium]|nr:TetR/AcrR family transcriptional regulator [Pseudomonadota bacterium]